MKSSSWSYLGFGVVVSLAVVAGLSNGCSSSTTPPKDAGAGHGGGGTAGGAGAGAAGTGAAGTGIAGSGAAGSTANQDGSVDAPTDGPMTDGSDADGPGLTTAQARGQYLTSVLGCVNCHTPKLTGGALDTANLFSGVDCTADTSGNCLSTPNLTADATGIKNNTDQQVIDAFRTGKALPDAVDGGAADGGAADGGAADAPDAADAGGATEYLFANMPYYQFAPLTDTDAQAIVSYLRVLKPVAHAVKANAGTFATPLTAPQWTPIDPTKLPTPGTDASADATNGKYFATLLCATCHTVNVAASDAGTAAPLHVDETKAFQGGKTSSVTVDGGVMMFQAANLTPDTTGIKDWSSMDLVTAIRTAKDKTGKTLCAPMRANAAITAADATAIADYLLSLAPVANTINACPARM